MNCRSHCFVGIVPSPLRDTDETGGSPSPEVARTPEAVSGHLSVMTSQLHDVMATPSLLFAPHLFWHRAPLLSLSDFATFGDRCSTLLPEVGRPPWRAVDSGSGSGNGSVSGDEECRVSRCGTVASTLPLDLSPPRSGLVNSFSRHGNFGKQWPWFTRYSDLRLQRKCKFTSK